MELRNLLHDDDAVSPVIGVILMVAITVILAAVIGAFVLDLGSNQEVTPQATYSWSQTTDATNGAEATIEHTGGDSIPVSNVDYTISSSIDASEQPDVSNWPSSGDKVEAGDTLTFGDASTDNSGGGGNLDSGMTIRITWHSDDGSTSATLDEYTVA